MKNHPRPDIANVLGCREKMDGALRGNGNVVTWGFGHILSQADPEVYDAALKEWSLESLPIVPNQWQMVVPADKRKQFNVIKKLLASCSEVVIATDADREGEVIAREILEYVGYTCRYQDCGSARSMTRVYVKRLASLSLALKPKRSTGRD
ncbi:toprim domain-containing protein (plasmid) [Vibrio alginolyticus]